MPSEAPDPRVRVVIVDDTEDLRVLLKMQFSRDPRFLVVGEAADGRDAIEVAAQTQPDLMILDRQMPGLGGLEAMPDIRRVAPSTAIVLYTANADPGTYQAAIESGALSVLQKAGGRLIDRLVDALVERADPNATTMEVHVGPVSSEAACVWVDNAIAILDAVAANPDVLDRAIPEDVDGIFRSFLAQWRALAESTEEFEWVAQARPADARRIIEHWATVDGMTDEQLDRLGVQWSPPVAQPFFQALTTGVLEALGRHEGLERLASRLVEQWAPFRTGD